MPVTRIGYVRNYVGLSTDEKPVTISGDTIPAGSIFTEADTGTVAVWDGYKWALRQSEEKKLVGLMESVLAELQAMNELHRLVVSKM